MDFSVMQQIGLRPVSAPGDTGLSAPTSRVAVADEDQMPWYSPRNPLVWLGALAAVTVGAAGFAGSVRIGKAKVSVAAGK